ncbi:hypothetical protein [Halalkalibacterium halodurans]|uniref:Uncharacterized protein n=1 Tax=Halalkalibacterium halodurans TaxID=86665 RepID=A0A0M0KJE7_ALKHA|nr:hypothetical protein [Halalkalibacterium halodurans]TPE67992.1 hypothetical protein AMD02_015640 [Halalkalibacterium halodurans]
MRIIEEGAINQYTDKVYIEFSRAEEVAEFGEHAETQKFAFALGFDMKDEKSMAALKAKMLEKCKESGFDTIVIYEQKTTEYLFLLDEDGEQPIEFVESAIERKKKEIESLEMRLKCLREQMEVLHEK